MTGVPGNRDTMRTKMLASLTLEGNLASEGILVFANKALIHLNLRKRADQDAPRARW
jgi:hypothetical protein